VSGIDVILGPSGPVAVTVGGGSSIDVTAGTTGPPGPPGPPGPEGGTPVVPVPYNSWPPANPVPNTLYIRLAP